MIDPTDLDDPAKAEAFVRECLDDLNVLIARLEAEAEKEIQRCRERLERLPDNPSALLRLTRLVQDGLHWRTEPLKQRRDELVKLVAQADALRARMAAISE